MGKTKYSYEHEKTSPRDVLEDEKHYFQSSLHVQYFTHALWLYVPRL